MTTLRGFLAALWVIVSCISAHDEPLQTSHQRRQGRPLRRTISHFGENGKTTMEVDGHMTWEPIISLSNELHARSRIRVGYSAQLGSSLRMLAPATEDHKPLTVVFSWPVCNTHERRATGPR